MINIGVLTSSRADFGIYKPLLLKMKEQKIFNLQIIAFGTHLSQQYGYSIMQVEETGIPVIARFDTVPVNDSPAGISGSMALVMQKMTEVWQQHCFDLILALGDRYEMFAAVASALPFNLKVAHIHGGETTLGAIDNALRHSITHMSALHFTAAEEYRKRVIELTGSTQGVFNTGALSVDNLTSEDYFTKEEIIDRFGIDLTHPTILITLHPESIGYSRNEQYALEMIKALSAFSGIQQVITMPNADTSGLIIRKSLQQYSIDRSNVFLVENFGSKAYLSVMKYATLMLGNTSSGFIEAAHFPKWVVNIGNRQSGRIRTPNIIDVPFDYKLIGNAIKIALNTGVPPVDSIYGDGNAAGKIIKHILDECSTD